MSRTYANSDTRSTMSLFALLLALGSGCHPLPRGYLVGNSEVREKFGVKQDTFLAIDDPGLQAAATHATQAALTSFGIQAPAACVSIYRGGGVLLGYALSACKAVSQVPLSADGSALVLLSPQGDSVQGILLSPGQIVLNPQP